MLIAFHRHLRRHRAHVLGILAVIVFGTTAFTAHAALMGDGMGDHDIATVCIVLGAIGTVTGGAALAAGRSRRVLWTSSDLPAPARASVCARPRRHPRAGPPALLQVFRF
jgi:hypothetical protein